MKIQPETLTLEFRTPIQIGKGEGAVTYTHVELREPTAGDLEHGQRADTPVGAVINLVSTIGKVPRLVAEKMSSRDINAANKYLSGFQDGPETAAAGQN
jgi:hypothetical protein